MQPAIRSSQNRKKIRQLLLKRYIRNTNFRTLFSDQNGQNLSRTLNKNVKHIFEKFRAVNNGLPLLTVNVVNKYKPLQK